MNDINEYMMSYGHSSTNVIKPNNTIIMREPHAAKNYKTMRPLTSMLVQGRNVKNLKNQDAFLDTSHNLYKPNYFTA
jgi:hypothetical protein